MKICPVCQLCYEDTDVTCEQEGHDGLAAARVGTRLIADKYRLDRLLARGGMGAVYAGTHVELDRPVAVKLLLPNLNADTQAFERFRREARATARIKHHNVADIYDYGVLADDEAYIVMELVDGKTLYERLKQEGQLPFAETIAISRQIAEGLEAAHQSGIIHRDLKPSNVILNQDAGDTRVKIIDFGIAKISEQMNADDSTLTATGMLVGTPRYMSPEQCLGEELDARSDIYSFGVIIYEMLAGRPPFDATSAVAIAFKHIHEPPPPLEEHRRNVPPSLANLIADSLSIDPAGRPQTATELKQRLEQVESSLGEYAAQDQVLHTPPIEEVDELRTQVEEKNDDKGIAANVLVDEYATAVMEVPPEADTGKPRPFFNVEKEEIKQAVPLKPAPPTSEISTYPVTAAIVDDPDKTRVRRRRQPSFAYVGLAAALVIAVAILWVAGHHTASKSSETAASTVPATTNSSRQPLPSPATTGSNPTKSENKPAEQAADAQKADASSSDEMNGTVPEEARTEVNGALDEWVAATNAGDVEKQMTFYSPTVEAFYRTRNVSSDDVRAEKERLFEQADKIEVHAGEPEIKFSRDGQTASTRFRKRYVIEGPEENRRGEVLQELRWKKTDKGWKIVSERDLRVLQKTPKPPSPPPAQANNSMWPHQVVLRGFKKLFQPNH